MVRLVIYLVSLALIASGLAWLADRPGILHIEWQGLDIETTVFRATVLLAAAVASIIFLWSILRALWNSPAVIGERIVRRRQKRGLEALSSGMIAVGAGDQALATRYALQARKSLPHEPLTHLLRAQAAQLTGDRATARRIFESMLADPDTEQLGLRGLFLEAEREGVPEAARQFAERALNSNPKLGWSADALFDLQCKQKNWAGALATLALAKKNGHIEKTSSDRKRAVLLAGQAQDAEESEPEKALALALEAHALAPDLVPAAAVAGRVLAGRGNIGKAAKVIQKTWTKSPHPELATVYAYARIGDSARDRLDRIRQLAALNPHSIESPIAIANTAIESRLFEEARQALEPLLATRLTQRVATLMARVEAGERGDKGRVREWLARAVNAARDPAWTADGFVSERWEPISPITGAFDALQWRVPIETLEKTGPDLVAERLEELLAISAPAPQPMPEPDATPQPAPQVRQAQGGNGRDSDSIEDAITVRTEAVEVSDRDASPTAPRDRDQDKDQAQDRAATGAQPVPQTGNRPAAARATPIQGKPGSLRPDPKVFISPPAPDDPGPNEGDGAELGPRSVQRQFRAVN